MDIGMLWNDDNGQRSLAEKVARAAEYFRGKYGERPTVCYVHPSLLPTGEATAGGVRLMPSKSVLVNHFWLGVNGGSEARGLGVAHAAGEARSKRPRAGAR